MSSAINFDGFSCPLAGLDTSLAEMIAVGHARQVVEAFLDRHAVALASASDGLIELISGWLNADASFDDVWDVSFGSIYAMLMSAEQDPVNSAALLGLRLAEIGIEAEWQVRLKSPAVVHVHDTAFSEATAIQVERGEHGLVTFIDSACSLTERVALGSHAISSELDRQSLGQGKQISKLGSPGFELRVVPAWALPRGTSTRLLVADAYRFNVEETGPNSAWTAACLEAMSLLERVSPSYVQWVSFAVKTLVPLPAKPGIFNSGGERFSPGVVCMSDQPYIWPLAEMLVHEATHQYMQLLARVGELVNGSDLEEYYSPFRSKKRPLFFIVVAYHAFANVLLFYREARAQGLQVKMGFESEAFDNREATLEKQLASLEITLQRTNGLSPLGHALWQPLHRFLHEERLV